MASLTGPLLAGSAGLVLSSCVSGPVRTVRSGIEHADTGGSRSTSQNNLIEVGVQDRLGPNLEYRVDDKFSQSTQWLDTQGSATRDETTSHRPSLDLRLDSGPWIWSQTYRMQEDRLLVDSGPDNRLVRRDALQKLEWVADDLPQVTGWFNYRTVEDRFFVEQVRVETQLQVRQSLEPFSYELGLREEQVEDVDTDVESRRRERLARVNYDERHFDDSLSTSLSLFATERNNTLEVPAGTTPTIQLSPVQGFADVDLTPQISTLTSNPGLIDGNVAASTGIDIGGFASGGQLSWNMAVEIPTGSAVDVVQIKTALAVPPNLVNGFAFSVWASDDNTFWTLVQSSSAFVYDSVNQHFRLNIPRVARRYLKIVNSASPAAAPSVIVTELEVFLSTGPGSAARSRTEDDIQSATGTTSWRVTDSITLGYDLFAQLSEADANGVATRDETRVDNGLWASYAPAREFDANLRASHSRVRDDVVRNEDLSSVIGVLNYRPLPTLDFGLSRTDTEREIDGNDDLSTHVTQLLTAAQLLRTLRAELILERNQIDDITNQREIARWITSASLIADLTATFQWSLRARNDEAEVTGVGASGIPDPSDRRYESIWLYRPTERLIAELELQWVENSLGDGLDQRMRLDWIPFADGAIDLQLDFDRTRTESFSDTQIDRYLGRARYTIDSHTYLELQYAAEDPDFGPSTQIIALTFHFNS